MEVNIDYILKELIEGFISRVNTSANVEDDWGKFVSESS